MSLRAFHCQVNLPQLVWQCSRFDFQLLSAKTERGRQVVIEFLAPTGLYEEFFVR